MSGTNASPPGWYPDGFDESRQRWWDGAAWTGHQRVSRFPGFVERGGRPRFRGRSLFPSGDGEYERAVRVFQGLLLAASVLLFFGLPAGWVWGVLVDGELSLAPLLVPTLAALVLMLAAFIPLLRMRAVLARVREAHARGGLWVELGPDGAPGATPASRPRPPPWG